MRRSMVLWAAPAALVLLLGACGGEVAASGNVGQGPASGDALKLSAQDNKFSTDSLKAKGGEEVTVEVTNEGSTDHNFVIDELNLSTGTIKKGEVATATFTMPDKAIEFVCSFHPGMKGELVPV